MTENNQLTPTQAFKYVGDLVAEYMKTLPPPIRGPVTEAANSCFAMMGAEFAELEKLRAPKVKKKP